MGRVETESVSALTHHAARWLAHPIGRSRANPTIACEPCERRGRFNIAKLIEQHGAGAKLTDLLGGFAENCPKARCRSGASQRQPIIVHDQPGLIF
jgi:hypothetical protein